jgi:hypothetical protein
MERVARTIQPASGLTRAKSQWEHTHSIRIMKQLMGDGCIR